MGYTPMKDKLWQSDPSVILNPLIEKYTVGSDYLYDQQLVGYDIEASKAHAQMLESIGVLTAEELQKLLDALDALYVEWQNGEFVVLQEQEDAHTAIEQYLIAKTGDTGKKIHTGRSRNDQAMVMMRLYLKDRLQKVTELSDLTQAAFVSAAKKSGAVPMPGYTHLQKAMPTTVALWLGSYADGYADMQALLGATYSLIDQNPLGSAAGFGVSVPINRDLTTKILGFKKTQDNPMYCGLSRGLFELLAVQALTPLMVLAGKFAHDMLIFTTEEFDFFSLPHSFTSGSSIMPHKHNYDLFEVMRGRSNTFSSFSLQLQAISSGIGSGYQRDLQFTKSISIEAFNVACDTLEVLALAVSELRLNQDNLAAAITDDMQSVSKINVLVGQGIPFRDAYHQIKNNLQARS